jgi:uncharacterized protein
MRSSERAVDVRQLSSGRILRTLTNVAITQAVAFSPDGTTLACGSTDESVTLWNYHTGQRRRSMRTHVGWVGLLVFSPDGSIVACAHGAAGIGSRVVEFWSARTGELLQGLEIGGQVSGIAFSPDGATVAIGSGKWPGPVRVELWDAKGWRHRRNLSGHKFDIVALVFSRDGRTLASGDTQGSVKFWDVRTGRATRTTGLRKPWRTVVVSPDARMAAVPDEDGIISFYTARAGETAVERQPAAQTRGRSPSGLLRQMLSTVGMLGDRTLQNRLAREIKAQISAGADPNTRGAWGTTPLMFLAAHGDLAGVRDLLSRRAELNPHDLYGATALLYAARGGHIPVVRFLLDAGAELKDEAGNSLLVLTGNRVALSAALTRILAWEEESSAATWGRQRNAAADVRMDVSSVAWMLLYLGADPDTRDPQGRTPLMLTRDQHLVRALISKGADVNARDNHGTPIIVQWAIYGQTALVKMALDRGADVNAAGGSGDTVLMFAAQNGNVDLAQLVLARGADPNRPLRDGRTPLMLAISGGHLTIARRLLEHGVDLEARTNEEGYTALTYAATRGDTATVRLLLKKGANVNVRTKDGMGLLQLLSKYDAADRFGMIPLLRRAGAKP